MSKIFINVVIILLLFACIEKKQVLIKHSNTSTSKISVNPLPNLPEHMYFAGKKIQLKDYLLSEKISCL